ncbi:TPA: phosphatidylserine decarboxylase [Klebsiella pneumoniae]|nr:phosphatidylserine decarboxylase [Pedobacter himalayensis]HBT5056610.1 phosphatidylserine decarboxylase [Klebsiella pneumoniae]HBT5088593.1 phosphatidylserine decarboxylase [Klebsiella pneumoniae]
MSTFGNRCFVLAQYLVPQHLLSRLTGYLAGCRIRWFKNRLIKWFIARYDVEMQTARGENEGAYENFNAFFTRRLKEHLRPVTTQLLGIASPADGTLGQYGSLENDKLFQAKGHEYTLLELLGGDVERANPFINGEYATIYLAPRDYHRVHMPVTGTLREMVHIPGKLFSVNNVTASAVPRLFARNERVVCHFDTDNGPMAIVLVGAMIVSSIHTVWHGPVCPYKSQIQTFAYDDMDGVAIRLKKGEELGHFSLGSTVIMLFGANQIQWQTEFRAGNSLKFGGLIGNARR